MEQKKQSFPPTVPSTIMPESVPGDNAQENQNQNPTPPDVPATVMLETMTATAVQVQGTITEPPCKKMRVSQLLGIPQNLDINIIPDQNKTLLTASGEWTVAESITKSMPKDQGVPMTILTGFLGAGKSTVLNYILKADHGLKIAVLINEYGEVDIDNQLVDTLQKGDEGEPILLNNGCVCCTISTGFAEAVSRTLEEADARGDIPDYFIVETTGLADPKPIIETISNTDLNAEVYVDQVLTVVDSSVWTDAHYDSGTAVKQIESADTVLLSKTDLVDQSRVENVIQSIFKLRPNARILRSQRGFVPIAALFDLGVSMSVGRKRKTMSKTEEGKHAAITKQNKEEHKHEGQHEHAHEHNHEHGEQCGDHCQHAAKDDTGKKRNHLEEEGFSSISFVSEFPFSLRRFKDEFMELIPQNVFRAKGLLWFVGEPSRFIFHWSGQRYQVDQEVWPEGILHKNQLVIIGRNLDRDLITRLLEHCVVRPGEESEEELEEEEDMEDEELAALAGEESYEEGDDGDVEDGDVEDGAVGDLQVDVVEDGETEDGVRVSENTVNGGGAETTHAMNGVKNEVTNGHRDSEDRKEEAEAVA